MAMTSCSVVVGGAWEKLLLPVNHRGLGVALEAGRFLVEGGLAFCFRGRVQKYIAELEAASTHFMATLHAQIQRQATAPAPYPSPARRHQEDYGMPVPSPLTDDRPDLHGI